MILLFQSSNYWACGNVPGSGTVILDLNGDFLVLNVVIWSPLNWSPNFHLSSSVHTTVRVIFFKFYLFLAVLGFLCCMGFSLVAVSRGYPMVTVPRFLTAVASPLEHRGFQLLRLKGSGAQGRLWCSGLVAMRHVDLPRSGIKPTSPTLADGFFITEPAGKPQNDIFKSQICSRHTTFIFWVFLFVFLYLNVLLCLHQIPLHCYKVLHDMTAA